MPTKNNTTYKHVFTDERKDGPDRRAVVFKMSSRNYAVQMGTPSVVQRERHFSDKSDALAVGKHWTKAEGFPRGDELLKPIQ